jgi:hypothetical protein
MCYSVTSKEVGVLTDRLPSCLKHFRILDDKLTTQAVHFINARDIYWSELNGLRFFGTIQLELPDPLHAEKSLWRTLFVPPGSV